MITELREPGSWLGSSSLDLASEVECCIDQGVYLFIRKQQIQLEMNSLTEILPGQCPLTAVSSGEKPALRKVSESCSSQGNDAIEIQVSHHEHLGRVAGGTVGYALVISLQRILLLIELGYNLSYTSGIQ